jgi:hypothetical protein
MTTRIRTNLNVRNEAYKNAKPRLQAGLDNIANEYGANGLTYVCILNHSAMAYVEVKFASGAMLRDIVTYLDRMQVLD